MARSESCFYPSLSVCVNMDFSELSCSAEALQKGYVALAQATRQNTFSNHYSDMTVALNILYTSLRLLSASPQSRGKTLAKKEKAGNPVLLLVNECSIEAAKTWQKALSRMTLWLHSGLFVSWSCVIFAFNPESIEREREREYSTQSWSSFGSPRRKVTRCV